MCTYIKLALIVFYVRPNDRCFPWILFIQYSQQSYKDWIPITTSKLSCCVNEQVTNLYLNFLIREIVITVPTSKAVVRFK